MNAANTEFIKAEFTSIYETKVGRGRSVSYHFELKDGTGLLKIHPRYYSCFDYQRFKQDVTPGQMLEIRIDKNESLIFKNIKSVVSVKASSKEYINPECVNRSIQNSKIRIPLLVTAGLLLILVIKYVEKNYLGDK